jgi:hypothetical protein
MKNVKVAATLLLTLLIISIIRPSVLRAQGRPAQTLKGVISTVSAYNAALDPEKIFLQLDKPAYSKNDTLWFKAYVFDALTMGESAKSGVMYIEVADENGHVIARNMVSLIVGTGWGNIPLHEKEFPEGNYILRAYTSWMRNFDEHYVFTRAFTISSVQDESWLINSSFNITRPDSVTNVKASLLFLQGNNRPVVAEQLQAKITAGKGTLYRTTLTTGIDGVTDFNFNLPDKVAPNSVTITLVKKAKGGGDVTFSVPVIINRDEKSDLQFMPEGGNLIAGISNRVAFKAISEEGLGIDVSGEVYNSKQQKVASFKSTHLGMGVFDLTPEAGEKYTSRISIKGKELSYTLPAVKSTGMMLHIENSADSLLVNITPTDDLQQDTASYYLIAQARGVVCYGALFNTESGAGSFTVTKSLFPTGIARFTLLNAACQPVAERIVYIDQRDGIRVKVAASKPIYGKRDSVNLAISATDKNGKPVKGNFGLAVTDDAQVKPDSTGSDNILYNLLLMDDLKGNIEHPGWYFETGDTAVKAAALDNLLLTQGWVNYNWNEVFQPLKMAAWQPEKQFAVKGRMTNAFNKPDTGAHVLLLSTKPVLFRDTTTDKTGQFLFTNLYPVDTMSYALQARNKHNGNLFVGIDVDEFKPPVWRNPVQRSVPWYVNIDTGRLAAIHTQELYAREQSKLLGIHQLKEVEIKANKIINGSKNLLGPGDSDFALDESDIRQMSKATLEDILRKNIKGFVDNITDYRINNQPVIFIFDGMSASNFIPPGMSRMDYERQLMAISATDIKGIEVMTSAEREMRYTNQYLSFNNIGNMSNNTGGNTTGNMGGNMRGSMNSNMSGSMGGSMNSNMGGNTSHKRSGNKSGGAFDPCFIEITTYAGNGLFLKQSPGLYVYQPLIFAPRKEFYSPRYTVKKPVLFMDTRSTLFWKPNVFTDSNGRCTVGFYTGDMPGVYNISIQGADLIGGLGAARSKIRVE